MSWQHICTQQDLVAGSGVAALINGEQVALFYLPEQSPPLYAIGNHDPIGGANVLSRGIVGDINGELVVASPPAHRCLPGTGRRVGAGLGGQAGR